jgi:hypothetical protein
MGGGKVENAEVSLNYRAGRSHTGHDSLTRPAEIEQAWTLQLSPLKSEFQEIIIGLSSTRKSETERRIVDGINCTI